MSVSQDRFSCLCVHLCVYVCVCERERESGWLFAAQPGVYPGHHSHFTQGEGVGQVLLKLCQRVCVCVCVCVCMHLPQAQKRYYLSLDMFFHLAFFLLDRHHFGCQSFFFLLRPFRKVDLIHCIVCGSAWVTVCNAFSIKSSAKRISEDKDKFQTVFCYLIVILSSHDTWANKVLGHFH